MLGPNPLGMTRPNPLGMPGFGIKQKRVYGTRITPNYILCLKMSVVFHPADFTYSTSSVSSTATDYQHSRRAVLAWAVGPCGLVLKGLKDSSRRYANYAVVTFCTSFIEFNVE